jgi:butyrate kinase
VLLKENSKVLVINPGSTSTKIGIYAEAGAELVQTLLHSDEEMEQFRALPALAQLQYRAGLIEQALNAAGYADRQAFAAVGGRGGLLPPTRCGTYRVDETMVEALRRAQRGEHASNLGAVLALHFAQADGVNAYIVDPVTVDEWEPVARLSGAPLVPREAVGHALNIKAVARRFAHERNCRYEDLRLIVIHLGSGITVSAHRDGRMIDNNTAEDGPFGPDRSGALPVRGLIRLATSGRFTAQQMDRQVFGDGGLFAYLGTRDLREVERRMEAGDGEATAVFEAMTYQIAKETGAMATVLQGKLDAILLTGGMAFSHRLVARLKGFVEWMGPVILYPGEDELLALAEGVFRVLRGEEEALRLATER